MRVPHYLAGNKGGELPHAAVWVDTETDQIPIGNRTVKHVLRFGWACYQRTRSGGAWTHPDWFRFTTPDSFWDWIEQRARPKVRLFIFAHNWSFDGPVLQLFDILPSRGWTMNRAVLESPPVILSWRREKTTLQILDTLNWWRMPLAKIGESINQPKLSMPSSDASLDDWDTYAKNDVEVIRVALHQWWRFLAANDLGGFAPTLASQALRSYRHRFMPAKILIDDNPQALELARNSLHGGRTEAFRIGKIRGPINCLDVNSMYPAVMASEWYPARLIDVMRSPDHDELAEWLDRFCVVASVDLRLKRPRFAHVNEGRLMFPVGRITECLTTPDLIDALRHGEIIKIHSAAVYEREKLFASFVDDFYRHRQAAAERGNKADSWRFKILMNSLYGKFAQRGERWEVTGPAADNAVELWVEINADTGAVRYFRKVAGSLQERIRDGESHDSHPAIASHVTAYGRALLWTLIQKAGHANVFYVDTDSLYCTDGGAAKLASRMHPAALGALKSEGVHKQMIIHGAKDYVLDGKVVCKGVRANAVWAKPNEVVQEQWSTLTGLIRIADLTAPRTRTVTKTLQRVYEKGTVSADGAVSPLLLTEWR